MVVGVLAFQGDFTEHMAVLSSLRAPSIEVRTLEDLSKVDALIIPGGESTVIAKFLEETGVGKEIMRRANLGAPPTAASPQRGPGEGLGWGLAVYGTCAGAIVLAKKVTGKNAPKPLGLIDITVDRNAYGTQIDSFEVKLKIQSLKDSMNASFIRAPKIVNVGKDVEILASYKGDPVLVRQGRVLAGTFHSEVRGETGVHEMFLRMMQRM